MRAPSSQQALTHKRAMQHLQTVNPIRTMASLMMLQKQNRRRRLRQSEVV
jgi:hypothetical protein